MPIPVRCRNGHPVLADDGQAGQSVRCPTCGLIVPVPAARPADAPLPPEPEERAAILVHPVPEPPVERTRSCGLDDKDGEPEPAPGTDVVRVGLAFHYARLVVFLLAVLALLVFAILAVLSVPRPGGRPAAASPEAAALAALAAGGLSFLQAVLATVGSILCAFAPARGGARAFVLGSLVCDVAGAGLAVLLALADWPPLLAAPLGLASWALFLLFLKALAAAADHAGSVNEARGLLYYGMWLYGGFPAALGLVALAAYLAELFAGVGPRPFIYFAGLLAVAWVFLLIKYTFLMIELIGTLRGVVR